jgi:hypothetical protein
MMSLYLSAYVSVKLFYSLILLVIALKVARMAKKKNPHAVALGKRGGSKGGKLRAQKLSPERRSEIARKAVLARWAKYKKDQQKPD